MYIVRLWARIVEFIGIPLFLIAPLEAVGELFLILAFSLLVDAALAVALALVKIINH